MFEIKNHNLYMDGVSTVELANQFGTPLYVYSEDKILANLKEIKNAFLSKYENSHAAFACKAFCTKYICRLLDQEGFWLDVVSGGELYTAMSVNFPANRIEFNGNNKSIEEIKLALNYGVNRFVVDSVSEFFTLEQICKQMGRSANILFRITPNVSANTHDYISTGKKDSKFGIPLNEMILFRGP